MSWLTIALIAIVYLILTGIIAVLIGKRLAKMTVKLDEKWDESK